MKTKFCLLGAFVLQLAVASSGFAAADSYQVTGPILSVTDTTLVVEKNGERWEIARDTNTKSDHALKVGDKVTVHYRMFATKIESKPATGASTTSPSESKASRVPATSTKEKSK